MKNQYFADVNDYLKYGFLRCFSEAGLRLAICWMLTPDDKGSDGRKVGYLAKPEKWRDYDPLLFDHLFETLRTKTRRVSYIEQSGLIANASFFNSQVPDDPDNRRRWLESFLSHNVEADLIFFDPDNGVEVQSVPWGKKGSSKFLFWREIELSWSRKHSLFLFQHFCREKRESFVLRLTNQLKEVLPQSSVATVVTSNVVYFLVYRECEGKIVSGLQMISKRWGSRALIKTQSTEP